MKLGKRTRKRLKSIRHTPGPWKVTRGTNGYTRTWQVSHESRLRAVTIADCFAIFNRTTSGKETNLEHLANARVIAASPKLLAACRIAVIDAEQTMEQLLSPGGSVSLECLTRPVKECKAAIAEATAE